MSTHPTPPQALPAPVLSLACARFEDALAEGTALGTWALDHRDSCATCGPLARDLSPLTAAIRHATAPRTLPPGFLEASLREADILSGDLSSIGAGPATPARPARTQRSRRLGASPRSWMALLATAALAAMAYWAGGETERRGHQDATAAHIRVAPAQIAAGAKGATDVDRAMKNTIAESDSTPETPQVARDSSVEAPAHAAAADVPAREVETPARPITTTPEPFHPAAVPERAVDLPSALQSLILAQISREPNCPAHSNQIVKVTATVAPDGTLRDEQVLSYGADRAAHDCVGYALKSVLLAPTGQEAHITLSLTW